MQGNKLLSTDSKKNLVTFGEIKNKNRDNTFYFKNHARKLNKYFIQKKNELYNAFSKLIPSNATNQIRDFTKFFNTIAVSAIPIFITEYARYSLAKNISDTEESNYLYRFLLGTAIMCFSALHRITDRKIQSELLFYSAVTTEVMGIVNLYYSSYKASKLFFEPRLNDSYTLIASLGVSTLAAPGAMSVIARLIQGYQLKRLYQEGAQRSDTALIPAGITPVSNTWFQYNHFLLSEMIPASRQFQLGLISDNILNLKGALKRFRNLPALIADAGPQIVENLIVQREKIEKDYLFNTTKQKTVWFKDGIPEIKDVQRHKLRNGNMIICDDQFDVNSVPVSGDVISLKKDEKNFYVPIEEEKKFCINLKTHNGEDVWIEHKTDSENAKKFKKISLHPIRDGKHAGVLTGSKLNLFGGNNFLIRIKEQEERPINNNQDKLSVINQIIVEHKKRSVKHSLMFSIGMAAFFFKDLSSFSLQSIYLMFNLFQMMIPFSETFLRKMVNRRLLGELNSHLGQNKISSVDALRMVDLCNALGGYYEDKFKNGVAIISDKTGTLTTPHMNVLGLWTSDMPSDVQANIKDEKFTPSTDKQIQIFELFASAYTNSKKELEPEEFALLQYFQSVSTNVSILHIDTLGSNHFKKQLQLNNQKKWVDTYHLGLYRKFGGRFTLVDDDNTYYLLFCGIPRVEKFKESKLLNAYQKMKTRVGVLSRDWCISRMVIAKNEFIKLKELAYEDDKVAVESYLTNLDLANSLQHYATFIVDNPVKKGAEKFILNCKHKGVPVFVATGDTSKSAENIAKVLCPEATQKIITLKGEDLNIDFKEINPNSTIIFSGINKEILTIFERLMKVRINERPNIIFSEMSTEGKGILAKYLKENDYFVVANGDGTNDVAMMKEANTVIAHLAEDGSYAPGVDEFANLNDKQLQLLSGTNKSFYDLFEIHLADNTLARSFNRLANSQEKPSIALLLKSSKMSFELVKAFGVNDVKEMWQQHWCSVVFDLIWLGISYFEIIDSADLPADNKHLGESNSLNYYLLGTLVYAGVMAMVNYAFQGESTNISTMVVTLGLLDLFLKLVFNAYGAFKEPAAKTNLEKAGMFKAKIEEIKDEKEVITSALTVIPSGLTVITSAARDPH